MDEFDYKKKKKRERYYIKFSFYGLLICGIIIIIWGLYHSNHNVKILQYSDTFGIITGKGYGKTSKKSATPSYYVRFECVIDSVRYKMFEYVSKECYDTIQIAQIYSVKYLPDKNPKYNSMILFNKPIMAINEFRNDSNIVTAN